MIPIAESIKVCAHGIANMKSFKQFLSESITINGDFNGTLNVGGVSQEPQSQTEEFSADVIYRGNIHRISMVTESGVPSKMELTEYLQNEYPGSIVQNIYVKENSKGSIKVTDDKRYHPAKLEWI
jgi:hypothetical protein